MWSAALAVATCEIRPGGRVSAPARTNPDFAGSPRLWLGASTAYSTLQEMRIWRISRRLSDERHIAWHSPSQTPSRRSSSVISNRKPKT